MMQKQEEKKFATGLLFILSYKIEQINYICDSLNFFFFTGPSYSSKCHLKQTGRCDFTLGKNYYFDYGAGIALPKYVDVEFYNRA